MPLASHIDDLLSHEFLLFEGQETQEEMDARRFKNFPREDVEYQVWCSPNGTKIERPLRPLFRELTQRDIQFVLLEYQGEGYVALSLDGKAGHGRIVRDFYQHSGLSKDECPVRGGGSVEARKIDGKTHLTFLGFSGDYGRFNESLLKKTLDTYLDKRLTYECK